MNKKIPYGTPAKVAATLGVTRASLKEAMADRHPLLHLIQLAGGQCLVSRDSAHDWLLNRRVAKDWPNKSQPKDMSGYGTVSYVAKSLDINRTTLLMAIKRGHALIDAVEMINGSFIVRIKSAEQWSTHRKGPGRPTREQQIEKELF